MMPEISLSTNQNLLKIICSSSDHHRESRFEIQSMNFTDPFVQLIGIQIRKRQDKKTPCRRIVCSTSMKFNSQLKCKFIGQNLTEFNWLFLDSLRAFKLGAFRLRAFRLRALLHFLSG